MQSLALCFDYLVYECGFEADWAGSLFVACGYAEQFERGNPAVLAGGMRPADYMMICIPMIFAADWIVFLPNYRDSRGAQVEYALADYIGKQTVFVDQWPEFMEVWNEPLVV